VDTIYPKYHRGGNVADSRIVAAQRYKDTSRLVLRRHKRHPLPRPLESGGRIQLLELENAIEPSDGAGSTNRRHSQPLERVVPHQRSGQERHGPRGRDLRGDRDPPQLRS
jgi:hypothetical protein